jgi:ATP-dependent exoDNAse (exonuclease V) beta subunit
LDEVTKLFQSLPQTLKDDDDAEGLQLGLEAGKQNLERLNQHYQETFGRPLPLADILDGFSVLWDGVESVSAQAPETGSVRLLSIHQVQGEEFPFVAIPFLVAEEFPHTRNMPEVVSDAERQWLGVPLAYRIDEAEEARLLAVGMSRATHRLLLSCHEMDADSPVLPSGFYQRLLNQKRSILSAPVSAALCLASNMLTEQCDLTICHYHSANGEMQVGLQDVGLLENSLKNRYVGLSAWANLQKESPAPLFDTHEIVSLNASSMKTYMACPRQFYYRHVLRLPQPGSEAASLGSLIHRVMEVFNTQATTKPYTAERLKTLAEAMFLFQDDLDAFFAIGFQEDDLQTLRKLSPLSVEALRQRLLKSIHDLERKGYFERYRQPRQVQPEKRLEDFKLEGIERCRFSGTVDALVQLADGRWDILDYKTFRSAYSVGVDTCQKRFQETLDPLPEDEDLTHAERFASKMSGTYPKDYQLPLYYLACQQDPAYRGQLDSVALQIVRPGFADNPAQGAIRLEIPAEAIETNKQQLIEDIQRYIVDPILDSEAFQTNPNRMACGSCGYYGICDSDNEPEEAGEA